MRARSVCRLKDLRAATGPIHGAVCGAALLIAGCGFESNERPGQTPGDGSVDTAVDAPPDVAIDACVSFSGQVDTCKLAFEADFATTSKNLIFDTSAQTLMADGAAVSIAHAIIDTEAVAELDPVAILVHDFQLPEGAVLRAVGTRPFAIIASGRIQLGNGAKIDAAYGGAGSLTKCSSPAMAGAERIGGGGGGGGGGYSSLGGNGGSGDSDTTPPSLGGTGATSIRIPSTPQGGCAGAPGGKGQSLAPGGAGGLGGGAVYFVAADRIELGDAAVITVAGGGGKGGTAGDAGGGGGGSGGMIWLQAPRIVGPMAQIAANGGGGGEGASTIETGHDGDSGGSTTARAAGGAGGPATGADGGRGGSGGNPAGESVTEVQNGGGGGGGGGVGYIRIVSPDIQLGSISPPPASS